MVRAKPVVRPGIVRRLHMCVSVFVAPSLLFFALTGALQTFRIPDQKTAPELIQKLARVHKDDVFAVKPPRPKRPDAAGGHQGGRDTADKAPEAKPQPKPSTTALKWFFAAISAGIVLTTLFGLWMALVQSRQKLVLWALLIAGAAAPILILAS
jgi:hypothetical protein